MAKIVITFGTFDLFHIGHINILEKAKSLGNKLVVGVSSDLLSIKKKYRCPVFSQSHRIKILKSCKYVDEVFLEESLDEKTSYIDHWKADILVMGDDWKDKFDWVKEKVKKDLEVVYMDRTKNISSTDLMKQIINNMHGHFILHGTYKIPPVSISEIFPLKKYKFYNKELFGPNNWNAMKKYYLKLMPPKKKNIMKYGYRKWDKKKACFTLRGEDLRPAKIDFNYKNGCNKDTKKCIITNNKQRKNEYYTPICCSSLLTEILFNVTDFLNNQGITYFIYWGTLLGSLRHGGLIPWDTDADIYILEIELNKLLSLTDKLPNGYLFEKIEDNQYRVVTSKINQRHLDVYIATIHN